jgi:hypothetical protein
MERTAPSRFYRKAQQLDSHITRVTRSLDRLFDDTKRQGRVLRRRRMFYSFFTLALLILFIVIVSPHGTAESAIFYPKTCLGGWHNPSLAGGEPETDKEGVSFTDQNSAVLDANVSADIFCGEFLGDIPKDTNPNGVVVRIMMSDKGETATTSISGSSFTAQAGAILDANASSSPDFTLTESSTTATTTPDASSSLPSAEPEPIDTSSDTPVTPTTPADTVPAPSDTAPQSFLHTRSIVSFLDHMLGSFIDRAYAEDAATDTLQVDTPTDLSASSTIDATGTDSLPASTTESIADASSTAPASQLFEVLYTLDGKTWGTLGVLSKNEISGAQFTIPLTASSTWVDITQLQIQIKRLATFDDVPSVYLDGMSLEVTYGKQQDLHEELTGDPKRYDIAVATSTDGIQISEGVGGDGKFLNIGAPSGGQLIIYSDEDGTVKFSMGVGSDPVAVSSYIFDSGSYTAIMTNRVNGCTGLTRDECRDDKALIGWTQFDILPTRETPTQYLPQAQQ